MSSPTRSDVHVSRPLTNISIAYIQDAADFIADKVFPTVPVMKQADRYFVYTKDDWFRTQAQKRAPASESAGANYEIDNTPNYFCDPWAVHKDVDDQVRANSDQPLDPDRSATRFVTQQMLLRREIEFISKYLTTGIWTGFPGDFQPNVDGQGYWDSANSDPMSDVDTLKSRVKATTGFRPNTMVVSEDVFLALKNNHAVLDRIKYTQTGIVTEGLLASLFGVAKFLVASAVLNSAAKGKAASMDFIASNKFLLVYAAPAPSLEEPSAGYIFSWAGLYGAGAQGNRISKFRMEHLKADRVEGEMAFDMKQVGADLGALGYNVLAP